jgi:hypothetical protein
MSELLERVRLNNLVYGDGVADNFKNNSIFFYNKYSKSDNQVSSIGVGEIQIGRFYHLHYQDDSNWMKYSPVFTVDVKKFESLIILMAVNFNFIPVEVRISIFDKFMNSDTFENDRLLSVDFTGVYNELKRYGFEYAIVEYNIKQVKLVHKINMIVVPRFLYSSHPINKYDPRKLYEIWSAKISKRNERDAEMSKLLIDDFIKSSDEIAENYKMMKDHINRVKRSIEKYGR